MEMPADTASDRVAAQLVGNPRDVLASLLQGSRYDYIVIGSSTDPDALSAVILTPHAGGSGGAPAAAAAIQPAPSGGIPQPTMPNIAGGAGRPEINDNEDEAAADPQPAPQPPPPQAVPPQGVMGAEQQPNPGLSPGNETGQPPQPKTPEQLLRELQRMQQQQQRGQDRRPPEQ